MALIERLLEAMSGGQKQRRASTLSDVSIFALSIRVVNDYIRNGTPNT